MSIFRERTAAVRQNIAHVLEQSRFLLLVRLALQRLLHNTEASQDEVQSSIGVLFGLLALPGAFVSIMLFEKYGGIFHWMYGVSRFDTFTESLRDEYFFITFAMTVCGAIGVWKWELLLPEKRDYMALVPLPLRLRSLFLANVAALVGFTLLFAFAVNGISIWLFPWVACAATPSWHFFIVFALSHGLAVLLASIFGSMAIFATVGTLMAILPESLFRRISVLVRSIYLSCLLALLFSVLLVPGKLKHLQAAPSLLWVPSLWFVGICQVWRGQRFGLWPQAARSGAFAIAAATAVCCLAYAVAYRRYFLRIPERVESITGSRGVFSRVLSRWADRWLLRTPFQRACYRFSLKTLLRSDRHRLLVTGFAALGAIVGFGLVAFEAVKTGSSVQPSALALAAPFPLLLASAAGLRFAFDVPADLRARWIFQMTVGADNDEAVILARKLMLSVLLPVICIFVLPIYSVFWSWQVGVVHGAVISAAAALACEVLLLDFHKIPFTCAPAAFGQGSIARVLIAIVASGLAVTTVVQLEIWSLRQPGALLSLALIFSAVWWGLARYREEQPQPDRELSFDDSATRPFELLNLNNH